MFDPLLKPGPDLPLATSLCHSTLERLSMPVWIYSFEQAGITWANPAALSLWSASDLDQLRARDLRKDMTETVRKRLLRYAARLVNSDKIEEIWTFYPNGAAVSMFCRAQGLRMENDALGMLVEATSIGSPLPIGEALRAIESLRHSAVMVVLFSNDGSVRMSNPAAENALPAAQVPTGRLRDLFVRAEDHAAVVAELETQGKISTELELLSADGARWYAVEGRKLLDPLSGHPDYLLDMVDVTERHQLQEELSQREHSLRQLLRFAPVPLIVKRIGDGAIQFYNERFVELMEFENDGKTTTSFSPFYCDEEDRWAFIQSTLENELEVFEMEATMCTTRNRRFAAQLSGMQISFNGYPCVVIAIIDIEKLKAEERSLGEALESQRQINRMQRHLVSMASHEFRTPLAIIDSAAQRIRRRSNSISSVELVERVDRIRASVTRMVGLVDTTLDSARLDEGKVTFNPTALNLRDVVAKVVNQFADISPNHDFLTELDDLSFEFLGDGHLLEQVFSNLISNAVKYSPGGGKIRITGLKEASRVLIKVGDRGIGIPQEELPHVMEKFYRASTATGIPGTGIGLNMARQIVEMHGGIIAIESAVGEGSTFTVKLPLEEA